MASGNRQGSGGSGDEPTGATEPITLTDPDGAVTRVAPWSSWTREQVRAPGGEPALVTRLDQGQLWFSAGRRRSPWRHEVHVGPAIVSTPRGRFQAVAEADGGATISCLAGRTRVVAGLREPVLLGPDQSAAVSSDGRTLVVMDRALVEPDSETVIDLTDDAEDAREEVPAALASVGAAEAVGRPPLRSGAGGGSGPAENGADEQPEVDDSEDEPRSPRRARLGWLPELVAVAALLLVVVAAVWVFSARDDTNDASTIVTSPPATTDLPPPTQVTTTTESETELIPPANEEVTTTEQITTTSPPSAAGASAVGELRACRRAVGGVAATVVVSHQGGPASRFEVDATLVDDAGAVFATGSATSDVVEPGGSAEVEVLIPVDGPARGSCELGTVTAA